MSQVIIEDIEQYRLCHGPLGCSHLQVAANQLSNYWADNDPLSLVHQLHFNLPTVHSSSLYFLSFQIRMLLKTVSKAWLK